MEYGCIGERLGHSFSKIIHNKLYSADYELKEIPKSELAEFMKIADFKAINVTIPYKQEVIPFLDEISDTARKIGAVNTVVNRGGKLYGYNTDFSGLKALIMKNKIEIKGKKVLILGSGGTSKTALAVAKDMSASEAYRLSRKGGEGLLTYTQALDKHTDAHIIINTTPCGMYPNLGGKAIDISAFPNLEGVVDAVYNPLKSALVLEAQRRGINAVGGLYMLVAQGVFAAEKFLDKDFAVEVIDRIYGEILREKQNIVLIGMPACGKSTVGSALARLYGKDFADTDSLIEKKEGLPISRIFEAKGEKGFRKTECETIMEIGSRQGLVIATGGGAVLNALNVEHLRANGILIFLDRSVEKLVTTPDRPLSSNREDLQKRYNERYELYCNSADYIIDANGSVEENINFLKEVLKRENFGN